MGHWGWCSTGINCTKIASRPLPMFIERNTADMKAASKNRIVIIPRTLPISPSIYSRPSVSVMCAGLYSIFGDDALKTPTRRHRIGSSIRRALIVYANRWWWSHSFVLSVPFPTNDGQVVRARIPSQFSRVVAFRDKSIAVSSRRLNRPHWLDNWRTLKNFATIKMIYLCSCLSPSKTLAANTQKMLTNFH